MAEADLDLCPRCGAEVAPRPANGAWPFCGDRCKWIDLGAWIEGDYRIPAGPDGSAEGEGEDGTSRGSMGRYGGGVAEG